MTEAVVAGLVAVLTSAATMGVVRQWLVWRAKVRLRELDAEKTAGETEIKREDTGRHVLESALNDKRAEYHECRKELAAQRKDLDDLRIVHAQCPFRITALEQQNKALTARVERLERISEHPPPDRDTQPERPPLPPKLPRGQR